MRQSIAGACDRLSQSVCDRLSQGGHADFRAAQVVNDRNRLDFLKTGRKQDCNCFDGSSLELFGRKRIIRAVGGFVKDVGKEADAQCWAVLQKRDFILARIIIAYL